MSDPQDIHDDELPAHALKTNKAPGQSPGEMLRAARTAYNYSVPDLCAQTMLSHRTVAALEDNEFASLSQPVFARGYYRKCAKVLDMDVDALMAAYGEWADEPAARAAPPASVNVVPQDVTPPRWRAFGVVSLVIVLLIALFAIYLVLPNASSPGDTDADAGSISVEPGATLSDETPEVADPTGARPDDAQAELTSPFTTSGPEQPVESSDSPDVEANTTLQMSGMAADDAAPAEAPAADTEPTVTEGDEAGSDPAIAPNVLTLEFDERSWVDVRDATDERLLTGIYEAGTSRTFDGQPPYSLVLGYAPGVAVRIGGEAVDIASEITDNSTARLTVAAGSTTQ